jgi:hypothetical protein
MQYAVPGHRLALFLHHLGSSDVSVSVLPAASFLFLDICLLLLLLPAVCTAFCLQSSVFCLQLGCP